MNASIQISLSTWLILLYIAIGLVLAILEGKNISDGGKRILRSWCIMFLWALWIVYVSMKCLTLHATNTQKTGVRE